MANIIEITDFMSPALDVYARLAEPQLYRFYEPKPGLFIAESPKVIERALDAGYEPVSMLLEKKHIGGEARGALARCSADLPVYTADIDVLTKLTGFRLTRGVLCAMRRKGLGDAADLCRAATRIAVLEHIVNPTNIGAIFRSAAALGMDAVLLTPACCDPLYRRAIRVSMGAVFQIPWTFFSDKKMEWPRQGMDFLHKMGFKTAAMALQKDAMGIEELRELQVEKLAVLLGAEGDGLSAETVAACDYTACIPMGHGVDSLNVAAAGAVAFWELCKREIR